MAADDALDLASATPAAPVPAMLEAYASALASLPRHLAGGSYHPLGVPELREALARRYTERGLPTAPEQVLVTSGAEHALGLALDLAARPGDGVLVEHPTYPAALDAARHRRTRLVPVDFAPAGWDAGALATAVRVARPRLAYLVPDFHNPTGLLMPTADRVAVAEKLAAAGVLTVVDETLVELSLEGASVPEPFAGHGRDGLVVTIGSASKSFWFGLRLGWARADARTVRRLAEVRDAVGPRPPPLEQLALLHLLERAGPVLAARRAEVTAARDALSDALGERLPGWRVERPTGGLVLWADLGRPCSSAMVAAAARHGVRLSPGPRFGVDGSFEDRLRLPYVQPPAVLREAVDRLAAAWAGLSGALE